MKKQFKIGDRVIINSPSRVSHGSKGFIDGYPKAEDSPCEYIVKLDKTNSTSYSRFLFYYTNELELDKVATVKNLIKDL